MLRKLPFSLFILLSVSCVAQNYLNQTATWVQKEYFYSMNGDIKVTLSNLYFSGDTVANGKNYMKLYEDENIKWLYKRTDSLGMDYYDTVTTNSSFLKTLI